MRSTTIRGIEDQVNKEIIGNIELICAIGKIGKIDGLVSKATLSGEELLKILADCRVENIDAIGIRANNHYEVTAYDW